MPNAYDPTSPVGMVRLLCVDTNPDDYLFTDAEIGVFLSMEGDSVKRAAAQAIDTIADNEALLSKAITTQDLQTDGAKVAAQLHARAATLRAQADREDDDAGYSAVVPMLGQAGSAELSEWP